MKDSFKKLLVSSIVLVLFAVLLCSCDDLLPHKADSQLDDYYELVDGYATNPEYYQTEIEDVVKYTVALTYTVIEKHDDYYDDMKYYEDYYDIMWDNYINRIDDFIDVIGELWLEEDAKNGYEVVLSRMAKNYDNNYCDIAKDVLTEYRSLNIVLSDYQRISTSSQAKLWQFKELKTGIRFTFCFYLENNIWECEPDEESYSRYIEKNL